MTDDTRLYPFTKFGNPLDALTVAHSAAETSITSITGRPVVQQARKRSNTLRWRGPALVLMFTVYATGLVLLAAGAYLWKSGV